MGLALSFVPFLDECFRQGALMGPVLGLGDVKFHESPQRISEFAIGQGMRCFSRDKTVRSFLNERYGIEEYFDCDLHDRADLQLDLVKDITADLVSRFGLILNAGTLEHIFDQRAAFENVHRMLRPGGVVLHIAPVTWYEHAYYNYNPRLFRDIAEANKYSLIAEAFHERRPNGQSGCVFTFKDTRSAAAADKYSSLIHERSIPAYLLYMVAYRKPAACEDFKEPYDVAEVAPEVERSPAPASISCGEAQSILNSKERGIVNQLKLVELTDIRHDTGNSWVTVLPDELAAGEAPGSNQLSPLMIFEDSKGLGPASSLHSVIRETGGGAFSHWNRELYFSTSDNSSPLTNKRRYTIAAPLESTDVTAPVVSAAGPVNYSIQGVDAHRIAEDSDYAVRIARSYIDSFPGGPEFLKGKNALELGPGTNFATALSIKALGAHSVCVADRFLAPFIRDYHEPLYREVGRKLLSVYPTTNVDVFESYARDGYKSVLLSAVESPMEEIGGEFRDIDLTLSNAVFEHLFNPLEAIRNLYEVMATGGIGFHQVDFRYHTDFDRPLEYLLMDEISYARMFDSCHGECGNRTRPVQMTEMFKRVGFTSVECQGNMFVEPGYLKDFMIRLAAQRWNLYRGFDEEDLSIISARFVIRK
jgi:SAM-dependent methyltransferase